MGSGVTTGWLPEIIVLDYTRTTMSYVHCCGSVISPGAGVGCNICII